MLRIYQKASSLTEIAESNTLLLCTWQDESKGPGVSMILLSRFALDLSSNSAAAANPSIAHLCVGWEWWWALQAVQPPLRPGEVMEHILLQARSGCCKSLGDSQHWFTKVRFCLSHLRVWWEDWLGEPGGKQWAMILVNPDFSNAFNSVHSTLEAKIGT